VLRGLMVVGEAPFKESGKVNWRNGYGVDAIADGLRVEVEVGKPHRRYPKDVLVLARMIWLISWR